VAGRGRISVLPPDRRRFPSAARGQAEALLEKAAVCGPDNLLRTGTVRGPAGAVPRCACGQNWDLELGNCLVFSSWCLELGVWGFREAKSVRAPVSPFLESTLISFVISHLSFGFFSRD